MITKTTMLYLYVETPLHAGVGSGLSSIDLPIQRERTTQYPMIQGSGIKGKLRSALEGDRDSLLQAKKNIVDILFGPPTTETKKAAENDHAGALIVGDARILLFPVRSLNGVFAYTTSHDVLNRFKREIERNPDQEHLPWNISTSVSANVALVATQSDIQANNRVVLEEFSFTAQNNQQINDIAHWLADHALPNPNNDYWHEKLRRSLVILPDNDFRDFALYATEIITRVRIERATKTVQSGALWTEEHLPNDTLLYVPLYATKSRKNGQKMEAEDVLAQAKTLENLQGGYIQLGGDETVGRGIVRMHWGN